MCGRPLLVLLATALGLAACGGDGSGGGRSSSADERCRSAGPGATGGYPSSIALLGHSWGTGVNSDPKRPGAEVRANSWGTGTNPAVNSVYRRILAHNPAIEGCAFNGAVSGASVDGLEAQARQAIARKPPPQLMLIQIMDNDIVCPARASDYEAFGTRLVSVLELLARGAPGSRLFVVSQFGSPTTRAKALRGFDRRMAGGPGACDYLHPDGRLVPEKLARLERIVHGYEAQLEAACGQVRECTYDGGAFGRIVDRREYLSSDLNHPSVQGHAKAAAVAWQALRRTGLVP
jgi:hypothetical protein